MSEHTYDQSIELKSRVGNFITVETNELFLCKEGVQKHWVIPPGTKKIVCRLHNKEPSRNAHRFLVSGVFGSAITIKPETGESWNAEPHGTYSRFGRFLTRFRNEANVKEGWMEISIIG